VEKHPRLVELINVTVDWFIHLNIPEQAKGNSVVSASSASGVVLLVLAALVV